ncbi:MFS transporter [Thermomonospora cellulosilytica]|uniref:DHA1 family inner membrane transport protein n=1 Tax=Thermomonospora cellulosilytica TaxID=1411118 RepID=A0A7W3RAV2_9ACTN|nr:MFS transporter [Thermomonospora cellulosilytica]MBA9006211.1 DHA1 family inner membrane transport protein [Thermomonospora cellulosilytica]
MRAVAAVVALAVAAFCFGTTESLPVGLLPLIAGDLAVSTSAVGLLVTGYGLTVAVVSVPLTKVTGRIPRRYLLSGLLAVFAAATCVSAAASGYWVLLAARVVTALSQAVFWPVAVVAAAGLFSPRVRGRAASFVFAGGSLAVVLGVPLGTWLGQQTSWRVAFWVLGGVGMVAFAVIAVLLPTSDPGDSHAATATAPDARRFRALLAVIAFGVGGVFTFLTYITAFVTEVSGFSEAAITPLLMANGVADVIGLACSAALVDRGPRALLAAAAGMLTTALLGLYAFGPRPAMTVVMVVLLGLALPCLATAIQARVLEVAPGSTDVASAAASAAFNVGIGGGALLGGLLLPWLGVRTVALAGAVSVACALAVLAAERAGGRDGGRAGGRAADQVREGGGAVL